ncbi:MAG: aminoacyl-tRNA hydrolase [Patescibacteria group bacterium]
MNIIVGLGNPGKKYENTGHNVGFSAMDELAGKHDLAWKQNKKANSLTADHEGDLLVKPQTFMNRSGIAVQYLLAYYKLLPKKWKLFAKEEADLTDVLTVIHDDVDLPLGKYRVSRGSGSGGHKGVESIIKHIKTKNFTRIRIGIRTEAREKIPTPAFVLKRLNKEEKSIIDDTIQHIIKKEL